MAITVIHHWQNGTCECGTPYAVGDMGYAVDEHGKRCCRFYCAECVEPHMDAQRELAITLEPVRSDRWLAARADHRRLVAELDARLNAEHGVRSIRPREDTAT